MNGSDRKLETLGSGGAFFECPRWHDGRLWVSDYWRYQVVAIAPKGATETVLLRVENGSTMVHADLSAHSGPQSNDMVIDAAGRAYVSAIDFEAFADMATTNLVRVDPDESVSVAADGLLFPNGSVITPDESTLIVAESWAQRLTAFDIRPDGSLTNRREWAGFAPPQAPAGPGQSAQWSCAPDGITLDAEGAIWVADAANKRAIRVREGGQILEELRAGTWTSLPAPWAATTGTPCSSAPPPTSGSRRRRRPGPGQPASSSPAESTSPTPAAPEMERMDRP